MSSVYQLAANKKFYLLVFWLTIWDSKLMTFDFKAKKLDSKNSTQKNWASTPLARQQSKKIRDS